MMLSAWENMSRESKGEGEVEMEEREEKKEKRKKKREIWSLSEASSNNEDLINEQSSSSP